MTNKKETASQKRMREFHEAQVRMAAARDTAKQKPVPADDDE